MHVRFTNCYMVTMILIGQGILLWVLFIVQEDTAWNSLRKQSHLLLRSNFFTQKVISSYLELFTRWNCFITHYIFTFKASLNSHWIDMWYGYEQRPRAWTLFAIKAFVRIHLNNKNNNHYLLNVILISVLEWYSIKVFRSLLII